MSVSIFSCSINVFKIGSSSLFLLSAAPSEAGADGCLFAVLMYLICVLCILFNFSSMFFGASGDISGLLDGGGVCGTCGVSGVAFIKIGAGMSGGGIGGAAKLEDDVVSHFAIPFPVSCPWTCCWMCFHCSSAITVPSSIGSSL